MESFRGGPIRQRLKWKEIFMLRLLFLVLWLDTYWQLLLFGGGCAGLAYVVLHFVRKYW